MGSPEPKQHPLEPRVEELERELAELRATHERAKLYWGQLEAILDGAPLAVYLKDAGHGYVLVNRAYERLAGATRAQILGRNDYELFPEPVARLFREQDEEVRARAAPVEFSETIPLADGVVHSFITSKFPLTSGSGELLGVAGVCTEITELELARHRLELAQTTLVKQERLATLGELSAVIAHEVRNPLGVIFNSLASLRRGLPRDPQADELLGIIGEEADRLNRMVGALLELARPVEAELAPTPVVELAAEAIEAARTLADPAARVRLQVQHPLPLARVDRNMLRQALVNLISNAIQAPERRSAVRVVVRVEEDRLRVDVVDDGAGVPPELAERIFAPFFTTRAAGTGLGLAVVRRAAEAHGGTVELEPTPGGGATFVLRLPLPSELRASPAPG